MNQSEPSAEVIEAAAQALQAEFGMKWPTADKAARIALNAAGAAWGAEQVDAELEALRSFVAAIRKGAGAGHLPICVCSICNALRALKEGAGA